MEKKSHIKLEDLLIYKLAREISKISWEIYNGLDWREKKVIGDQFIQSSDSIGANIAEAYGRFHYLDRVKFCYNSRGSLIECSHWVDLMRERKIDNQELLEKLQRLLKEEEVKLNNYIKSIYKSKNAS